MELVVNITARPLYLRERPNTHCIGGWLRLRVGLYRCGKPRPHRDSITGRSSPLRVAIPIELSRLRTRKKETVNQVSRTLSAAAVCNLQQNRPIQRGVSKW